MQNSIAISLIFSVYVISMLQMKRADLNGQDRRIKQISDDRDEKWIEKKNEIKSKGTSYAYAVFMISVTFTVVLHVDENSAKEFILENYARRRAISRLEIEYKVSGLASGKQWRGTLKTHDIPKGQSNFSCDARLRPVYFVCWHVSWMTTATDSSGWVGWIFFSNADVTGARIKEFRAGVVTH